MFRKLLMMCVALALVASLADHFAYAGEITAVTAMMVDDNTHNAEIPILVFWNPNDVSVEVKFVALLQNETSSCVDEGTPHSCGKHPPGSLDGFETTDGLVTATIPALSELSLGGPDLIDELHEFGTDVEMAQAVVQVSWADEALGSDGSLRKITPIKAFDYLFGLHLTDGSPDGLNSLSISQIQ